MKPSRKSRPEARSRESVATPARISAGRLRRDAIVLFLGLWFLYGATIDRTDVYDYALQQFVIASLVGRGTYAIGEAGDDRLKRVTDTFVYNGRRLPAKQPGQFTIGALAYLACAPFGIAYNKDRILASAAVTWLTSSLLSALSAACMYLLLAGVWGFARGHAAFATVATGAATTLLPYSGVAHHDILAASCLVMALFLIETSVHATAGARVSSAERGAGRWRALAAPLGAGVLLGLTLCTSMLPAMIVLLLVARVALARERARTLALLGGLFAGLLPLLSYNAHYFGSPFLMANAAGGFTDTFFRPGVSTFLHHLNVYLGAGDLSVLKYMPIVVLGGAGLALLDRRLGAEKRMLWAAIGLHLAYVMNIETIGGCQYGPRYLIPIVPLAMLGLPALLAWGAAGRKAWPAVLAGALALGSAGVNLVGALGGTMVCDTRRFALFQDLGALARLAPADFPLAPLCLGLAILAAIGFGIQDRLARSGRWSTRGT